VTADSKSDPGEASVPSSARKTESGISIFRIEDGHLFTEMGATMRFVVWPGVGADKGTVHYLMIEPGEQFANHVHPESVDMITVIQGEGILITDGTEHRICKGDVIYVPPGVDHGMRNDGNDTLVSVDSQAPPDPVIYSRIRRTG
jgi:quercetin dioxygenase-like cupin family protein